MKTKNYLVKIILMVFISTAGTNLHCQTSGAGLRSEVLWMYDDAKWGISHHYLAGGALNNAYYNIQDYNVWNHYVINFDVNDYAEKIKKLGVGYVIMTLTQNRGVIR